MAPLAITEGLAGLEKVFVGEATKILEAALIFVIGLFLATTIRRWMRRSLSTKIPLHIYKPLENLVFYVILFIAAVSALRPFGLDLGSLIVAGGLASIVIGLAAQDTLGDIISGVFLMIEQPLRIGDPVEINGIAGEVIDVRVLSTLIRTWDGHLVRIPNRTVFNTVIVNYVRTRARRIDFRIGVHYESDVGKAIKVIQSLIDESPYCLLHPAPEIYVDEYSDSSIVLRIRCWTPSRLWYPAKMYLQTALKDELEKNGIRIPYPQLDLHIVSAETEFKVRIEEDNHLNPPEEA